MPVIRIPLANALDVVRLAVVSGGGELDPDVSPILVYNSIFALLEPKTALIGANVVNLKEDILRTEKVDNLNGNPVTSTFPVPAVVTLNVLYMEKLINLPVLT